MGTLIVALIVVAIVLYIFLPRREDYTRAAELVKSVQELHDRYACLDAAAEQQEEDIDAEREDEIRTILSLVEEVEELTGLVSTLRGLDNRLEYCNRALRLMEEMESYPLCREVVENFDKNRDKIRRIRKILPFAEYFDRAGRHRFKGNSALERDALLDALYEAESSDIADEDLRIAELLDAPGGKPVTLQRVTRRLQELGGQGW